MTGRYAARSRRAIDVSVSRARSGNPPLSHLSLNGNAWVVQGTRTVAHAFQEAGWGTGMTGKWHLSSTVETGTMAPVFSYTDAQQSPKPYEREELEVKRAGFSDVFGLYPVNMRDTGFKEFSHNPEWCAVESFDFMDRMREKNKKSFLYFAFTLPHMPKSATGINFGPTAHLPNPKGPALSESVKTAMNEMRDRARHHIAQGKTVASHHARGAQWIGGNDKDHNVPGLLWIDSIMGEFVAYLEKHGEFDSSLIAFSADHGCVGKGEKPVDTPSCLPCLTPHTVDSLFLTLLTRRSTFLAISHS